MWELLYAACCAKQKKECLKNREIERKYIQNYHTYLRTYVCINVYIFPKGEKSRISEKQTKLAR